MTLDPQLTGAALLLVGVATMVVLGTASMFLSGFAFNLVAACWMLMGLGFVLMGGSANE